MEKRVVVSGGNKNLYKVSSSGGKFYIYQVSISPFFNDDYNKVGEAYNLDDALKKVQSHSGYSIKSVSNW